MYSHWGPPQAHTENNHLGYVTSSPRHIKAMTWSTMDHQQEVVDTDSNDWGFSNILFQSISAMFLIWAFWKLAGFDPLCQIKYCMKLNGIHPMNAPSPDVIWIWTFFELKFQFNDIKQKHHTYHWYHACSLGSSHPFLHFRNSSKQQGPRCLNHSDQPHEANNTQDVGSTRGAHLPSTSCSLEDFFLLDSFESH